MHHFSWPPVCTSCLVLVRENCCRSAWVSRHVLYGSHADTPCGEPAASMFPAAGRWLPLVRTWNTFCLFLTHRSDPAGNWSRWMVNVFNYWLVVNQKVWELEIKRQPEATGIIHGSDAIFYMNHQRLWLFYRYWILIPASVAPLSRPLAFLTRFIRPMKAVRNELIRACLQQPGVSHWCHPHSAHTLSSQRSKTASETLWWLYPFSVCSLYACCLSVSLRGTQVVGTSDLGCTMFGKSTVISKCTRIDNGGNFHELE